MSNYHYDSREFLILDEISSDTSSKLCSSLANLQSFTEEEFDSEVLTVSYSYGVEFAWEVSDRLLIEAWSGLPKVTTLSTIDGQSDRGTQDVWNWAVTLVSPKLDYATSLLAVNNFSVGKG